MRGVPVWLVAVVVVIVVAVVGIEAAAGDEDGADGFDPAGAEWADIAAAAQGQTVRLWMWGGEAALNDHIDDEVIPAEAAKGVTLERVPIDDTASAIARLVAEADSGTGGGAIDLLRVNGKNFEQGSDAGLWLDDWVPSLPNAALLDPNDPTLWNDFGVPTKGQEMPWSRAVFVFAALAAMTMTLAMTVVEVERRGPERVVRLEGEAGTLEVPCNGWARPGSVLDVRFDPADLWRIPGTSLPQLPLPSKELSR